MRNWFVSDQVRDYWGTFVNSESNFLIPYIMDLVKTYNLK